jgi:hypothetical protein
MPPATAVAAAALMAMAMDPATTPAVPAKLVAALVTPPPMAMTLFTLTR